MKLADQQAALAKWVLDKNAKGEPDGLSPLKDLSTAQGASLYRDSILEVEIRALKITFPIVLDLVGDKYFRAAARQYLRGSKPPSHDGDLDRIGESFPAFFPTLEGAQVTPYIKDVARLELGIEAAANGPDAASLNDKTLKALSNDPATVTCALCPNATLLKSEYPVDTIRSSWLDGFKSDLDISNETGDIHIIVWRLDTTVDVARLTKDEWTLLHAVAAHPKFMGAVEHALNLKPDIDIAAAMTSAVTNRWLEASSG